jgi:hypothetical protein
MLTQIRIKLGDGKIIVPPYYYFMYKCVLDRVSNEKGTWWMPRFTKYTNEKGAHVKTQDMPNGQEIFEQAKMFQEQFLEGTIQQETFDQPQGSRDIDDDVPF